MIVANENVKSTPFISDALIEGNSITRPVNSVVALPPLLLNVTAFVKIPGTADSKLMTIFVHSNALRSKGVPDVIVNGPDETTAEPFSNAAPALLITSVASLVSPLETRPKSTRVGVTTN